jgi:hypothetical protein
MNEIDKQVKPSFDKKTYQEPRLQVYGDIQTMTQTHSTSAPHTDNGHGGTQKTV